MIALCVSTILYTILLVYTMSQNILTTNGVNNVDYVVTMLHVKVWDILDGKRTVLSPYLTCWMQEKQVGMKT